MTDQAVDDHVVADELKEAVLGFIYDSGVFTIDEAELKRRLDRLFVQGKVIGRRTALPHGIAVPDSGQVWRLKTNTDMRVEVIAVSQAQVVHYRHIDCACTLLGHTLTEHESRSLLRMFKEQFEPVEEYDDLIEGWRKAVRGELS